MSIIGSENLGPANDCPVLTILNNIEYHKALLGKTHSPLQLVYIKSDLIHKIGIDLDYLNGFIASPKSERAKDVTC